MLRNGQENNTDEVSYLMDREILRIKEIFADSEKIKGLVEGNNQLNEYR